MREERRMEAFREVLMDYQLIDLGYSRPWFMWERGNFQATTFESDLLGGYE